MKSEHTLCKKKERHFIISIIIILIVLISGLFATTILGHSDVIKYNNKLVVDCCKMLPSEVGGLSTNIQVSHISSMDQSTQMAKHEPTISLKNFLR